MWTPGKSVEKSVGIKNTGESEKEIYLRIKTNESTGELDEHMLISLMQQGAGSPIWTGTLKELIEDETVLIEDFSKDEQIELIISAQMDSAASNELQGGSSVFDFGFGFEGDLSDDNGSEEDSDENDSNSNSNEDDSVQGSIGQILDGVNTFIFGSQPQALEQQGDVAGESSDEKSDKSDIMGISDECLDNNIWVVFLAFQIIGGGLYFLKKLTMKISIFVNGIVAGVVSLYFYFSLCFLWPILISLGIFVFWLFVARRKLVS